MVQAPGGVDGLALGVAEAAHVGGDQSVAGGRARHQVLVEAARGKVAMDHDHWHAVLGAGVDVAHGEAVPPGCFRPDSGCKVYGALLRGADDLATCSRNRAVEPPRDRGGCESPVSTISSPGTPGRGSRR